MEREFSTEEQRLMTSLSDTIPLLQAVFTYRQNPSQANLADVGNIVVESFAHLSNAELSEMILVGIIWKAVK